MLLQNAFTSREPRMAETCAKGLGGRFMWAVTLYPSPNCLSGMRHLELDPWGWEGGVVMQQHPNLQRPTHPQATAPPPPLRTVALTSSAVALCIALTHSSTLLWGRSGDKTALVPLCLRAG